MRYGPFQNEIPGPGGRIPEEASRLRRRLIGGVLKERFVNGSLISDAELFGLAERPLVGDGMEADGDAAVEERVGFWRPSWTVGLGPVRAAELLEFLAEERLGGIEGPFVGHNYSMH